MSKNLIFWLKMTKNGKIGHFWPKTAERGFFSKIRLEHGRTHERESIGPSANAERPKINKKTSTIWKKMAKNIPKPYNVTTSNVFLTQKWPKQPKQEFS